MRLRTLAALAVTAIGVTACSALSPDPATRTVTSVATSTVTAVTTAISTTWATVTESVTDTVTGIVTTTATPIMDIPGPDGGPRCAVDERYFDEPTDGLDAAATKKWGAAVDAAAAAGVTLCLNDGKRSRTQQQEIYDDYLRDYGESVADELVLPPDKSSHVTGFAIDVQPAEAYRWLQATKGSFGWCRTYENEPWHFEYRAAYAKKGCPDRLPEPVR